MSNGVLFLELTETQEGHLGLALMRYRESGVGDGYRIFGPKFDGRPRTTVRKYGLTGEDVRNLRRMLDDV